MKPSSSNSWGLDLLELGFDLNGIEINYLKTLDKTSKFKINGNLNYQGFEIEGTAEQSEPLS